MARAMAKTFRELLRERLSVSLPLAEHGTLAAISTTSRQRAGATKFLVCT
jgi:hypothetical protein|tara:strand:- start:11250 stop:11399 length:150 start_codon:yes stop_codon:yes gene_type:complete